MMEMTTGMSVTDEYEASAECTSDSDDDCFDPMRHLAACQEKGTQDSELP